MALARADLPYTHDAQPPPPGFLRLAVTLTIIAACYLELAWETGSWPW